MHALAPAHYRRHVRIATALLVVIVFSGAAVRLTGSGLGCDAWPNCSEGQIVPEFTYHGTIEYGNRAFSGLVSLAVAFAVLGAYRRTPRAKRLIVGSWGLVAGIVFQIVWGNYVVSHELHPFFVAVHFLASMVLLANALYLLDRATDDQPRRPVVRALVPHQLLQLGLGVAVILTGTFVTGAGPNSGDVNVVRTDFDLAAIARIHSAFVWLFLASLLALLFRIGKTDAAQRLRTTHLPLLAVTVLQGAVGYVQYFTGVPALIVFVHIVGATALWCALVWSVLQSWTPANDSAR
ncbi:MAG: COX15/CtaA family protein [Acidimicrobiales bacterium]